MEEQDHQQHRELQLLPPSSSTEAAGGSWLLPPPPAPDAELDLQLSMSCLSKPPAHPRQPAQDPHRRQAEALRWQAAEQIRMAAMEKAYAERVRELTRREMELAQAELARARLVWERARDDVARAKLLKENAFQVASSPSTSSPLPVQITCHSCRHRFRP